MMSSRQEILDSVRKNMPVSAPLPDLSQGTWQTFDDVQNHFAQTVQTVGGDCHLVNSIEEINNYLEQFPFYRDAKKTCSLVDSIGKSTFEIESIDDPHQLEDVDFAIIPGEFGVAENGAVWLRGSQLPHRVLPFLTQYLAIVIPAGEIVPNLHDAYSRISLNQSEFGLFLSGPSKTADIEQSLVIGAHGARSLSVFLLNS